MNDLKRGPVGAPTSDDPFERAQSRAPRGWHVEGQMFWTGRGWTMDASGPRHDGSTVWVHSRRATQLAAAESLVRAMSKAVTV